MDLQTLKDCFEIQLEQTEPLQEDRLKQLVEHRMTNRKGSDAKLKNRIEILKSKLGKKQLFYSKRKGTSYEILSIWEDELENLSKDLQGFRFTKMVGNITAIPEFVDKEMEIV